MMFGCEGERGESTPKGVQFFRGTVALHRANPREAESLAQERRPGLLLRRHGWIFLRPNSGPSNRGKLSSPHHAHALALSRPQN